MDGQMERQTKENRRKDGWMDGCLSHLLNLVSLQQVTRITKIGSENLRLWLTLPARSMLGVDLSLCGDLSGTSKKSTQYLHSGATTQDQGCQV